MCFLREPEAATEISAPFNKGVFTVARYCNAPLKLILIKGTNKLFQPGHFLFNTHDHSEIQLELIGSPEPDYKGNNFSISALADEARIIFEEKIAKIKSNKNKKGGIVHGTAGSYFESEEV